MPINGFDLAKMSDKDISDLFLIEKCNSCGEKIPEEDLGNYQIDNNYVCSGCYFDAISAIVEKFPIHIPRTHR
jgi:formylmethanofuran dehydrogenase subunit E